MIFQPIRDFTAEEVWAFLLSPSRWGSRHMALRKLYHYAGGDECPLVVDDRRVVSRVVNRSRRTRSPPNHYKPSESHTRAALVDPDGDAASTRKPCRAANAV